MEKKNASGRLHPTDERTDVATGLGTLLDRLTTIIERIDRTLGAHPLTFGDTKSASQAR